MTRRAKIISTFEEAFPYYVNHFIVTDNCMNLVRTNEDVWDSEEETRRGLWETSEEVRN